MNMPHRTDPPSPVDRTPLAETLRIVKAILADDGRDAPGPRAAYLRNALNCFPELHDDIATYLTRIGDARDIDGIIRDLVLSTLDPESRSALIVAGATNLTLATLDQATEVVTIMGGTSADRADAIYLAASARLLRQRLAVDRAAPDDNGSPGESEILALRRYFPAREAAPQPAPAPETVLRLDDLLIARFGFSDMSRLRSGYARHNAEQNTLAARHHRAGQFFCFGPYLDLAAGRYRLSMNFVCSKPTLVELDLSGPTTGVVDRIPWALETGATTLSHDFDWTPRSGRRGLFESRIMVTQPAFGEVAMVEYLLTCLPADT